MFAVQTKSGLQLFYCCVKSVTRFVLFIWFNERLIRAPMSVLGDYANEWSIINLYGFK